MISKDPIVGMLLVKHFQQYNCKSSRDEQLHSASLPRHSGSADEWVRLQKEELFCQWLEALQVLKEKVKKKKPPVFCTEVAVRTPYRTLCPKLWGGPFGKRKVRRPRLQHCCGLCPDEICLGRDSLSGLWSGEALACGAS